MGLDYIKIAQRGMPAIRNHANDTIRHSGIRDTNRSMIERNFARMEESIRAGRLAANRERKKRSVLINFSTELEL